MSSNSYLLRRDIQELKLWAISLCNRVCTLEAKPTTQPSEPSEEPTTQPSEPNPEEIPEGDEFTFTFLGELADGKYAEDIVLNCGTQDKCFVMSSDTEVVKPPEMYLEGDIPTPNPEYKGPYYVVNQNGKNFVVKLQLGGINVDDNELSSSSNPGGGAVTTTLRIPLKQANYGGDADYSAMYLESEGSEFTVTCVE